MCLRPPSGLSPTGGTRPPVTASASASRTAHGPAAMVNTSVALRSERDDTCREDPIRAKERYDARTNITESAIT